MPRQRLTYTEPVKLRQIHPRRSAYGRDTAQTLTEAPPAALPPINPDLLAAF
jgi:hypothetical protein